MNKLQTCAVWLPRTSPPPPPLPKIQNKFAQQSNPSKEAFFP